jgi:large subunit ribosomal protein L6
MSKVGKRIITIPEGVEATLTGNTLKVKGPKGELEKTFLDNVKINISENEITVDRINEEKFSKMIHGTTNSIIQGMVTGVKDGYTRTLEIIGVGYGVELKGDTLVFSLGLSHKPEIKVPSHLQAEVVSKTELKISGIDKQQVGEFAATIKRLRKPEPYGGKGIRYQGEYIRRKVGKAAA